MRDDRLKFGLIFGLALAACYVVGAPEPVNSLETVIEDMRLPHEAAPHGVPGSYDWARKPRVGMGNNPKSFAALTAWGQLYEDARGNPAKNARVQFRGFKAYILSKDERWRLVQDASKIGGGAFIEDFKDNVNKAADARLEPDGTTSAVAGGGWNYHFWPASGRVKIDPKDVAGVFVTVQARLIVGDPAKPDDRAAARYVLSVGADYWSSVSADWDNFKTNGDVGIGRFKVVTVDWRAFNMTSLEPDPLRRNPPPLE